MALQAFSQTFPEIFSNQASLGPRSSHFSLALAELPSVQLENLAQTVGDGMENWEALSRETDPANFFQALLNLGRELESRDEAAALRLLSWGAEHVRQNSNSASLVLEFDRLRDALTSHGAWNSERCHHLLQRSLRGASDPAMIGGFALGSFLGGFASAALTTRFTPWLRGANVFGRLGFRFLLSSASLSLEVPTILLGERSLRYFLNSNPTAGPGFGETLAGTSIFLGTARAFSSLGESLIRNMGWSTAPFLALPLGLGGVWAGQRVEARFLGEDSEDPWATALSTYLQMQTAAPFSLGLTAAVDPVPHSFRDYYFEEASELEALPIAAAGGGRKGERPSVLNFPTPMLRELRGALGHLASPEVLRLAESIGQSMQMPSEFASLLSATRITDLQTLEIALLRLNHLVRLARPHDARGNYVGGITRQALGHWLEQRSTPDLDQNLRSLYEGKSLLDYERDLSATLPVTRLIQLPHLGRYLLANLLLTRRISRFDISRGARLTLHRFLRTARELSPLSPLAVEANQVVRSFENALRLGGEMPSYIERALTLASDNPLGFQRVHRLYRVLSGQRYVYPKLLELCDPDFHLVAYRERFSYPSESAEALRDGQLNAYFNDPSMADFFHAFYRQLPTLTDPDLAQSLALRRQTILQRRWPTPRPLANADVLAAFTALGDPLSRSLVSAVDAGELRLLILNQQDFQRVALDRTRSSQPDLWTGFYVGDFSWEGLTRDTLIVRQVQNFSAQPFRDAVFYRMATMLHEYEHFRHTDPLVARTELEVMRQEMLAYQREFHWRAEHGDLLWIKEYGEENSLGWAMHLRDRVESRYWKYRD